MPEQFDYQDPTASQAVVTSDTFILAEQVGMDAHFGKSMFAKVAPVVYIYATAGNAPAPRTTRESQPWGSSTACTIHLSARATRKLAASTKVW